MSDADGRDLANHQSQTSVRDLKITLDCLSNIVERSEPVRVENVLGAWVAACQLLQS